MTARAVGSARPSTIRRAAICALVTAVVASVAALAAFQVLRTDHENRFVDRSRDESRLLLALISDLPAGRLPDVADVVNRSRRDRSISVDVVAVTGQGVVTSRPDLKLDDIPVGLRQPAAHPELPVTAETPDGAFLIVAATPERSTDRVFLFFAQDGLRADQDRLGWILAAAVGVLVVLAAWAGGASARRRLAEFTEQTERERKFNADMAHELRRPVAALVTAASLVDDVPASSLPAALQQPLAILVGQSRKLRALVDDLLLLARLEGGGYAPSPERLVLADAIDALAATHGWGDAVDLDLDHSVVVHADRRALIRTVTNLVTNALQHGGERVTIRVHRDGDDAVIEVQDDGPGVPADLLPGIFDRFVTGDRSEGSGLGLAIAKANAELLGGSLQATNVAGGGARIELRLPRAAAACTAPDRVSADPPLGTRAGTGSA